MNNYKKLFTISLLALSINQLYASWMKSAAQAAAGAGVYYSSDEQNKQGSGQVSVNPVVYPKSTDFKNYNAMADGIYKLPYSQSQYSQDQKVYKKTQFGAAGLREAIAKLDKFVLDELDEESITGLSYSQLVSDKQRIAYLKNEFKDYQIPKNDPVLFLLMNTLKLANNSDDICAYYLCYLKDYAFWNSNIISIDTYNKFFNAIDLAVIDDITNKIADFIDRIQYPHALIRTSYHEGAHALMCALVVKGGIATSVSNKPTKAQLELFPPRVVSAIDGKFSMQQQQLLFFQNKNTDQEIFNALSQLQLDTQNLIMMSLAGGIGDLLRYHVRVPTLKEFEQSMRYEGIGSRDSIGSDIYHAYTMAEAYIKWKHFSRVSRYQEEPVIDEIEFQQEVDDFMEESYQKAFKTLLNNAEKLDLIAQALFEKRELNLMEIYSLAGVERPKFDIELTFLEKFKKDFWNWFCWTGERMKFYEEQNSKF